MWQITQLCLMLLLNTFQSPVVLITQKALMEKKLKSLFIVRYQMPVLFLLRFLSELLALYCAGELTLLLLALRQYHIWLRQFMKL